MDSVFKKSVIYCGCAVLFWYVYLFLMFNLDWFFKPR